MDINYSVIAVGTDGNHHPRCGLGDLASINRFMAKERGEGGCSEFIVIRTQTSAVGREQETFIERVAA